MKLNQSFVVLTGFAGLAIAFGLANGRLFAPGLIWIVPGLLIALTRRVSLKLAISGLLLTGAIAGAIQWTGVVPFPPLLSTVTGAALGLVLMGPFLIDRLIQQHLRPIAAFFLFPAAQVSLEYGTSSLLPYASFGAWAYTQVGFPQVLQVASLFGFWSVSFVIACAASGIASLLAPDARRSLASIGLAVFVISSALIFGVLRLGAPLEEAMPLRIVGIASKPSDLTRVVSAKYGCGSDDCAAARADARAQVAAMFSRSAAAVEAAPSDLVLWSEVAAPLFPEDVEPFRKEAQAFASEHAVYFAPAVFLVDPGQPPWRNEVFFFDPQGELISTHIKAKPVPGEISVDGPDELTLETTTFGKVALAICFDMDFTWLARQGAGVRVVLVPGSDWPAIDPLHPHMVALRAVENGYAVVRPSRESVSISYDPLGRELARAEWRGVDEPVLQTTVSTASVATLYSKIGDALAVLCVLLLVALAGSSALGFAEKKSKSGKPPYILPDILNK